MAAASPAADFSSSTTFLRVGRTSYSAWKPFLTSTPSVFLGRSRTWPMEAFTWKSRPRYLLIVLAFAGDSTITRFFATTTIPPPTTLPDLSPTAGRRGLPAAAGRGPPAPARPGAQAPPRRSGRSAPGARRAPPGRPDAAPRADRPPRRPPPR